MNSFFRAVLMFLALCLMVGCARNPNVEIVGSYFPGWMVSLALGVVLTAVVHVLLRREGLLSSVGHPAIIHPALLVFFTALLWLCFFA
ncbi:YtcA family lipoprotein [Terriglobus tenax]|uniref:YtcA family lipoprotein n=1 Tax=Terriglobus tenax TaxID=1111115 RepID=UPI0021E0DC6C|nr:YtcA family lipoprotein [Terriglobus tenax]